MINIDLDTASSIVKQIYCNAKDPILSLELEATKQSSVQYRPYLVAAKFIMMEYRQVIKADDVTFSYDNLERSIRGLVNRQKELDKKNGFDDESLEYLLLEVCDLCNTDDNINRYIGVTLI